MSSLGLDAMVFLDDNPVERGLVRQVLPQVAVPELPDDPAWYARTLAAAGYGVDRLRRRIANEPRCYRSTRGGSRSKHAGDSRLSRLVGHGDYLLTV
jgi:predicted enzyme involved in methoxymalonyl-ACP biosynthesis